MKKTILTIALIAVATVAAAQMKWNSAFQQYIDQYKDLAIEQMKKYRIPASITLAQGVFESGAGRSDLARKGNNHFGIKCHGWQGRTVRANDDAPDECFRAYDNAWQSYEDHSRFLVNSNRYRKLFSLSITDYRGWAHGLKAAGYATNPRYAQSLISIIERFGLARFDTKQSKQRHTKTGGTLASFFDRHMVYHNNKNYFIVVEPGDDLATISKATGVSRRKLRRYNELPKDYVLQPGDILYLEKKQKEASKQFKDNPIHIVDYNQSMHDIAQLYGIRIDRLYKLNKQGPDYVPRIGDILRIR